MKNLHTSFEISSKLKVIGYDLKSTAYYGGDGIFSHFKNHIGCTNNMIKTTRCVAPLYQEVIDWFDSKNIFITIEYIGQNSFMFKIYGVTGLTSIFNSRLECTKLAILKAIELIKKI